MEENLNSDWYHLITEYVQLVLLIFLFVLLFKCIVYVCQRKAEFLKTAASLPGPPEWPLIGNGFPFAFPGKDGIKGLQKQLWDRYGSVYRLWFGNQLWISLSDPEDFKAIFNNSHAVNRAHVLPSFHKFFGDGTLGTQNHDIWKRDKKLMQPFFARSVMKSFIPQMNKIVDDFIENTKKCVNTELPDLTNFFTEPIAAILCRTLLGYEMKSTDISHLNPLHLQERVVRVITLQLFLPFLRLKFVNYFIEKIYLHPIKKKLYNQFEKILKNHRSSQENKSGLSDLSLIGSFSEILDDEDVKEKLMSLVLPGFAVPSRTLAYAACMIAIHPEIQQKLYKEIFDIFGDDDRPAAYEDIERLPYLDQVIKETERRFTTITFLIRELSQTSEIGSYVFPAGTGFLINSANVNFHPIHFPNPLEFNPENFSPEAVAKRPKYSFMPFGAGQRMCPGRDLAEIEMKLIIIALLRTFKLFSPFTIYDAKLNHGYVTTGPKGVRVRFELR